MSKNKQIIQTSIPIDLNNISFQTKLDYIQYQLKNNKEQQQQWKQYQKELIDKEIIILNQELEIQQKVQDLKLCTSTYPNLNFKEQNEIEKLQNFLYDGIERPIEQVKLQITQQQDLTINGQIKKKKGRKPGKLKELQALIQQPIQQIINDEKDDNQQQQKIRPKTRAALQKVQQAQNIVKKQKGKPGRKPNKLKQQLLLQQQQQQQQQIISAGRGIKKGLKKGIKKVFTNKRLKKKK